MNSYFIAREIFAASGVDAAAAIAANLQRLSLPRQSLVWVVLRKEATAQWLAYSLGATFLGRMCLSGELHALSPS